MNIKQLEYFVDLTQTLNYRQTAKNCYVSQTAITKQIQLLESELQVHLFKRDKKHVELTQEGSIFLQSAQNILSEVKQSYLILDEYQRGIRGNLKIGFIKGTDETLLVHLFQSFLQLYPAIQLDFKAYRREELITLIKQHQLDAIIMFHISDSQLSHIDIQRYQLKIFYSHDFNLLPLDQALQQQLIYDVRHNQQQDSELEQTMLKLCLNQGIAILHEFVEHSPYGKYLSSIPIEDSDVLSLYYHQSHFNQVLDNLIAYVKKHE